MGTMTTTYDAIVIGAGAAGSAAAYHLACDGQSVLLLEQFEIGHARGSSHGESRVFRFAYDDADYARLAMQCKPMWRALEAEAGERLLLDCDQIDVTEEAAHTPALLATAETLTTLGARCEQLDASAIRARYPQWRLNDAALAIWSPDSGILAPERCIRALVALAAARGAAVREREPVTAIRAEPGGGDVEVTTPQARYRAHKLVIAGGAWMNGLLAHVDTSLPLTVTREQPVYFAPRANAEQFALGRFPIFMHWRAPDFGYGFPVVGKPGIKVGFHHGGTVADPDAAAEPSAEVTARLKGFLQRYLPDAAGEPFDATTCLYTNTPDEHFIVDVAPGRPNVAYCSACSGHGFKFAIGLGRALADLVQVGTTELHIAHVRRTPAERRER